MGYPYPFPSLTPEQTAQRRLLLDKYGQLAQYSTLIPILLIQLCNLIYYLLKKVEDSGKRKDTGSNRFATGDNANKTVAGFLGIVDFVGRDKIIRRLLTTWRRSTWWADGESGWWWGGGGSRRQVVVMGLWTLWLAGLVVWETGDVYIPDYLHLTKRFGIVAASQLPIHYLLSAKCPYPYNPIQLLTSLSHEELNPYHRRLGRILIAFLSAHAILYLNFYVQMGFLSKRIRDPDVQLGLAAITSLLVIGTTVLSVIRTYSYRIFYLVHVVLSSAILPILYFHVTHIRLYIIETAIIHILSTIQRHFLSRRQASALLTPIPNTSLINIILKPSKNLLILPSTYLPGQHIYLSSPQNQTKNSSPYLPSLHMNPYSIANLPTKTSPDIHLVVRELSGTTKTLAHFAHADSPPKPHLLQLEGPYGASSHFLPSLLKYDAILLVAGGVGATFTIPIYLDLLNQLNNNDNTISAEGQELKELSADGSQPSSLSLQTVQEEKEDDEEPESEDAKDSSEEANAHLLPSPSSSSSKRPHKIHFVWTVRSLSDAKWDIDALKTQTQTQTTSHLPPGCSLYVTGHTPTPTDGLPSSPSPVPPNTSSPNTQPPNLASDNIPFHSSRPNLRALVDEVFGADGAEGADSVSSVAVLVCGPAGLGRGVRDEVGRWVQRGREVFWHGEEFGW